MAPLEILIVDDSPPFNHLTRHAIKKAGISCRITEQSNGRKAIDYLEQTDVRPDLILLDINMPVMDGFDFLYVYSQSPKCDGKSFIYMLTSSAEERDKANAQKFPIVKGYYEKPISVDDILSIAAEIHRANTSELPDMTMI